MATRDQNTVGLTVAGSEDLKRLMETKWFNSELDACRVAMVVAIRRGLSSREEDLVKVTTKYNMGTFDREGQVRQLLSLAGLTTGGTYEAVEGLMHAGLRALADELSIEGAVLTDA